jgi:hypothetical protein
MAAEICNNEFYVTFWYLGAVLWSEVGPWGSRTDHSTSDVVRFGMNEATFHSAHTTSWPAMRWLWKNESDCLANLIGVVPTRSLVHVASDVSLQLSYISVMLCFFTRHCSLRSELDVPTFATRRLHVCHHARAPSGRRWNCGREMSGNFA